MPLINWKPEFDLGVAAMDAEHKQLIDAMNHVHELEQAKSPKSAVDAALKNLVDLTVKHFADEERHMEAIGFPEFERHRFIHKDMLKRIGEHYEVFQQGDGSLSREFYNFLTNWLSAHICHIDRKYSTHPAPTA
ncbi:MAG TPA: bacteriohemerythrin [bacterium]|nr:bacteriohemerythrin [bacterium]